MQIRSFLLKGGVLAAAVALGVIAATMPSPQSGRAASTFVVNTITDTPDSVPGDGACKDAFSACSLRAAIMESNANGMSGDTIVFSIFGGGVQIISVSASPLPAIVDKVEIIGSTQPGYAGSPLIRIDGTSAPLGANGLLVSAQTVAQTGTKISDISVTNFPEDGIQVLGAVGLNSNVVLSRIWAGVTTDGVTPGGNGSNGIELSSASFSTVDSSVLSDNFNGVCLCPNSENNIITNSRVGTTAGGTGSVANTNNGVMISGADNNQVGVPSATTLPCKDGCNVISGNTGRGVEIVLGADNNAVVGNIIGMDVAASAAMPNAVEGVLIDENADNNIIGSLSAPNIIAYNNGAGVAVTDSGAAYSTGNRIQQNSIHSNAGRGIRLGAASVANDPADLDVGSNELQNHPILVSAQVLGSNTVVGTTLDSTPNSTFVVNYYSNPTCDGSGSGEGTTFLGTAFTSTFLNGKSLSYGAVLPVAVPIGHVVTATAMNQSTGDTSEFSPCVTVVKCATGDSDCDNFADVAPSPSVHQGPANTNVAVDSCIGVWNGLQENSDGNFTDLSPPKTFDDLTWPNSDNAGDHCDGDADNDGIDNFYETAGVLCGGKITDPQSRDTDGDRLLDGAECGFLATDPTVLNAANPPGCNGPGDLDADSVLDVRERCYYGTSTALANTDGDTCGDRREIASVNGDNNVNVIDLQIVAGEAGGAYTLPNPLKVAIDVSKNGTIDVIDLGLVAAVANTPCP